MSEKHFERRFRGEDVDRKIKLGKNIERGENTRRKDIGKEIEVCEKTLGRGVH